MKKATDKKRTQKIWCDYCNKFVFIDVLEDVFVDENGQEHYDCPICGYEIHDIKNK